MTQEATIGELLQVAIALEEAAQELYLGLEARFAHRQEVASFWSKYAEAEAGHARWLIGLRDDLSAQTRSEPCDPGMLKSGHRRLQASLNSMLQQVNDLEDAFQLADELENSEMNTIFEFMISEFSDSKETGSFLRSQLREHVAKLVTGFPVQYRTKSQRRGLGVLP